MKEAIIDCDQCLSRDSNNLKALLRKGEAHRAINEKHKALEIYAKIISNVDNGNKLAIQQVKAIKDELKDDQTIEEIPREDYDFAKLIRPKKIVPNKAIQLADAIKGQGKDSAPKRSHKIKIKTPLILEI